MSTFGADRRPAPSGNRDPAPMRSVPDVPETFGVFSTASARREGWTRSALDHAVRTGRLVRPARGVFAAAESWYADGVDGARLRFAIRSTAATMAVDAAIASHVSAAVLAGLPVWRLPDRACVTVRPLYTGDARCAHLHRARLDVADVVPGAPVPRTRVARTIVDIAREFGVEDAVVAGDAAVRCRMLSESALLAAVGSCAGWPGIRHADPLAALLDGRSESPLESVSRLRLGWAGLPAPEPQVEIYDLGGTFLGRPDFYWDALGVAGEVDGRTKYRDGAPNDVVYREKLRQEAMEDAGLVFVRWGRADLDAMPRLVSRIEAAMARAARQRADERRWMVRNLPRDFSLAS